MTGMVADIDGTQVLPPAPLLNVLMIDDHSGERTLLRDALATSSPNIVFHETENAVQAFWFLAKQREYLSIRRPISSCSTWRCR